MALHGSSYDPLISDPAKPPRKKDVAILTLLFLVFAAVLAIVLVPSVRTRLDQFLHQNAKPKMIASVVVWANQRAGLYYCAGSGLYGKDFGSYLKQGDALTLGYQPDLGKYCEQDQDTHSREVRTNVQRTLPQTGDESNRPTPFPSTPR